MSGGKVCQTPGCGHGAVDHTEWGKGPCEFILRGPDGKVLRRNDHPNGAILRCECQAKS